MLRVNLFESFLKVFEKIIFFIFFIPNIVNRNFLFKNHLYADHFISLFLEFFKGKKNRIKKIQKKFKV